MLHNVVGVTILSVICLASEGATQGAKEGMPARLCGRTSAVCDLVHRPDAPLDKPITYLENITLSDGAAWCFYHFLSTDNLQERLDGYNDSLYCVLGAVPGCVTVTVVIHRVGADGSLTWVEERKLKGQATSLPPVRDLHATVESNLLRVSWQTPGGLCLDTHYSLDYNGYSASTGQVHAGEQTLAVQQSDFSIRSVRQAADYLICVSAVSELAENSRACVNKPAKDLVPAAPQNLTVLNITTSTATLTWLLTPNMNTSLTHLVTWAPCVMVDVSQDTTLNKGKITQKSLSGSTHLQAGADTTYTIAELHTSTKYCVSLQASNFLGFGEVATAEFRTQDEAVSQASTFTYAMAGVVSILVLLAVVLCVLDCVHTGRKRKKVDLSRGSERRSSGGSYTAVRAAGGSKKLKEEDDRKRTKKKGERSGRNEDRRK